MNILLIGNPNVGKSAIFSHLTGISVTTSNYPGTTVEYSKGCMIFEGIQYNIIDVPGTYQLNPQAEAEKVAVDMIKSGDVLVNVLDATNLERNLNLTLQLIALGKPMLIVLNMWDDAKHKGINIDINKLEQYLKIPVLSTNGLTGEGLKLLQEKLPFVKSGKTSKLQQEERWKVIGEIVNNVQNLTHRHHTFVELLQDFAVHPVFGPFVAIAVLFLVFRLIITVGEFISVYTSRVFDAVYTPLIMKISSFLGGGGIIHSILIGDISNGIDFEGAMGVLTTGVFVIFAIVLPYIILFYAIFGFLEDFGYLPRIAVILDRLLHRVGLHGYSVIPMLLACGCNVPGVLAVRNLDTRRERFITAVITCITIPCMAQTALIVKAVGQEYLILTFTSLITVWAILGMILKKTVKGVTPTLLMEIPPYRMPGFKMQYKKLKMRISCFFKEAIPYVLGGILFINILHTTGIINWIGKLFAPLIKGAFGLPEETVAALIIGTVRKDAAVALLEPIGLNGYQMVVAVIVLTLYFPCVATFTVLLKELGIKDTVKAVGIMFVTTLIAGGGLNFLGSVFMPISLVFIEIALVLVCALLISGIPKAMKKYWKNNDNTLNV